MTNNDVLYVTEQFQSMKLSEMASELVSVFPLDVQDIVVITPQRNLQETLDVVLKLTLEA
jgi:hypothetical protein